MADTRTLDRVPSLGALYARAAVRRPARTPTALPARTIVVPDLAQDAARLAAYDRICGFGLTDAVPPTWLHVLTFPLQVALMAEPDFPLALAGLVHTANEMTLHRPVLVGERLRLTTWSDSLADHRLGHTVDLVGEVHVGDEPVWSGRSTYLARGRDGGSAGASGEGSPKASELPPTAQVWRLPADLGRRYARVSGDANPIHLSALGARAFGFRRPIAHGMWTHARALAALGGRLPAAYGVRVRFTKPIPLPGSVAYGVARTASGWGFAVTTRDGARPHLLGEVLAEGASVGVT